MSQWSAYRIVEFSRCSAIHTAKCALDRRDSHPKTRTCRFVCVIFDSHACQCGRFGCGPAPRGVLAWPARFAGGPALTGHPASPVCARDVLNREDRDQCEGAGGDDEYMRIKILRRERRKDSPTVSIPFNSGQGRLPYGQREKRSSQTGR